jgi:hypothetical protein
VRVAELKAKKHEYGKIKWRKRRVKRGRKTGMVKGGAE